MVTVKCSLRNSTIKNEFQLEEGIKTFLSNTAISDSHQLFLPEITHYRIILQFDFEFIARHSCITNVQSAGGKNSISSRN